MTSITLIGSITGNNGVSRYCSNLSQNMAGSNYREFFKKEVVHGGKKCGGYISSVLYQPFYKINSDIIHTLTTVNFYYRANVTTIHDLYFKNNSYAIKTRVFLEPAIIKWKLGRLKIIVPSEVVLRQFQKLYGSTKNVYVVPHGIDFNYIDSLNLSNPFKTKNNIVIPGGVDGKVSSRRNQRILLDALKHYNYNVYVVGYGFMDMLEREYRGYNNLHFIKNPDDTLFYSYLKYSDLNLYNTIGEGFGYIIYESLYLGKKVLINYNPDNILLFNHYANYYAYGYGEDNSDNLINSVDYYMGRQYNMADQLLKHYSIKSMIENTLHVYGGVYGGY